MDQVLMIGPASAGKTCYLSALEHAAHRTFLEASPFRCRLHKQNDGLRDLCLRGRQIIREGRLDQKIDASTSVSDYSFEFVCQPNPDDGGWSQFKRLLFGAQERQMQFHFLDGPGGALLPTRRGLDDDGDENQYESFRENLIAHARRAQALIVCADAYNLQLAAAFFEHLPKLLGQIASEGCLPFRRVVVLLTKAEMLVVQEGRGALEKLVSYSAWHHARQLLSTSLGSLLAHLDDSTEMACGWASAYGFIDGEGSANYDPQTGGLRTFDPNYPQMLTEGWRPLRVLDPLIYLTTGAHNSMQVFKKPALLKYLTSR